MSMNQEIPMGINLFNNNLLVKRNDTLYRSRRGNEVLFIEKESASHIILSGDELDFFNRIRGPVTVDELLNLPPSGLDRRDKECLLRKLYERNMVSLNGSYYHDPATMWQVKQKYPSFICFHLTHACNFRCKYCFAWAEEDHGQMRRMPREVIDASVKKIMEENPVDRLLIDFHGGEPFVAYDDMVYVIKSFREYNEKHNKKKQLRFICQTNGSLLTLEKVKALKEINCCLGLSLDGPQHVQDENRVFNDGSGTFNAVMERYWELKKEGLEPGTLSVIHDPVNYMNVLEFLINDLKKFNVRINYSAYIGRATEELDFPHGRAETFARYYLEMVDYIIDYVLKNKKRFILKDLDSQINNIYSKNRPFMCYRSPCGCGRSILGIGSDGGMYACEEAIGVQAFRLGSVFDEKPFTRIIDESEVLKEINGRTVENIPKCKKCTFKRFCGSRCTTKSFARFASFRREDPMCKYYQIVYEELIWKFHYKPEALRFLNPEMSRRFQKGVKKKRMARINKERQEKQEKELVDECR